MKASLNEKSGAVKWGEYKLGTLFDIDNTLSFNTDKLVDGTEYDYVTRTSINQGIMQTTGFVNKDNINASGTWSLGLLSMDFFYRHKPWYAGQFIRKITPKISIPEKSIPFFSTILNKQKPVPSNSDVYRAYFQSRNFTVLSAYAIRWKYNDKALSPKQYLFMVSCINKVTDRPIYSHKNKLGGWNIVKNKYIQLPQVNGEIALDYMETLISAIQKLAIKDVVIYADRKVEKMKEATEK